MNAGLWVGLVFVAIGALTPPALFLLKDVGALAPLLLAGYFLWPTILVFGAVCFGGGLIYHWRSQRND